MKKNPAINPHKGEFEVQINGKTHYGLCSINALRLFCVENNVSLTEIENLMKKDEITAFASIIYYSCINYAVRNNEPLNIKKDAFISFLFDDMDALNEVVAIISKTLNPEVDQEGEVDSEKK
jgi:hypothetical protein